MENQEVIKPEKEGSISRSLLETSNLVKNLESISSVLKERLKLVLREDVPTGHVLEKKDSTIVAPLAGEIDGINKQLSCVINRLEFLRDKLDL